MLPETAQTAALIAQVRGKVDINNCSKDDLVNLLGLPIVYANDIESLQKEGYIFTHLEELHEIAGIPENYLPRLAPLVTFSYDYKKEAHSSWKRLNVMSVQELIASGLESEVAFQIVAERQKRGEYKSAIDIKRRTNLPFIPIGILFSTCW
ncbi:MAG: helix-hairpin-helix domain-containing protein [Phormidium sp.]